MSVTREDLELAAMAVGFEVVCTEAEMHGCDDASTIYTGVMLRGVQSPWRPHTDPGDAARLAARLRFAVGVDRAAAEVVSLSGEGLALVPHNDSDEDAERAYCEAVTLGAATEGRWLRGQQ